MNHDLNIALDEQPSLSLEEMEKMWRAEETDILQLIARGVYVNRSGVFAVNPDGTLGNSLSMWESSQILQATARRVLSSR